MPRLTNRMVAIDFGTSNSAVCLVHDRQTSLIPLEEGRDSMPTAIFYNSDQRVTVFGRQALLQYEGGTGGRLMRSLKSLLGSRLLNETTLVNGRAVAYREIIGDFLAHLKGIAESQAAHQLEQLVLGRPVHFVDDDPARDRLAETTLAEIAREVGFREVFFQYEPIAAALDFEASLTKDELVLVVDIGGGTSDFSLIRLGPARSGNADRSNDVLASSGIHLAGTDFDRHLSLATAMRELGYESEGIDNKPVPSSIYFDLATWHKINFLYTSKALAQAEELKFFMADRQMHRRLMQTLHGRHGHRIASQVEMAKIDVAEGGQGRVNLDFIESDLVMPISGSTLATAINGMLDRIVDAASAAVAQAGITHDKVTALYFTGGSTSIEALRRRFQQAFPASRMVEGDKFSSVARGLGLSAQNLFAG
jgi:hypothetical chaperone protein